MFNYSSFKEKISRPVKTMSRSNVTTKVRTKKSSEPRANLSTVTAKRQASDKEGKAKGSKE